MAALRFADDHTPEVSDALPQRQACIGRLHFAIFITTLLVNLVIMWANFHMHSQYCDGKGDLHEYVAVARTNRMPSIGFSSHAPVPFACTWCMKDHRLPDYLKEIELLKKEAKDIGLHAGLEVDYVPGKVGPADFAQRLDYTIGSIHFIDSFADGQPWEIDGLHTLFLRGLDEVFGNDVRRAIQKYYLLTRRMLKESRPDVLGHLDKIKIQNIDDKFFSEDDSWYQREIEDTLDAIEQSNVIVEVNTRGIYQKKSATPYPSPWILERMHSRAIPITLSSDAHHVSDLTNRFEEVAALLSDIGFSTLQILHQGSWQPFTFNRHGINA